MNEPKNKHFAPNSANIWMVRIWAAFCLYFWAHSFLAQPPVITAPPTAARVDPRARRQVCNPRRRHRLETTNSTTANNNNSIRLCTCRAPRFMRSFPSPPWNRLGWLTLVGCVALPGHCPFRTGEALCRTIRSAQPCAELQ